MEPGSLSQLFALFSVDPQAFATINAITYAVVGWCKTRFTALNGWRTDVITLVVAAALSYQLMIPHASGLFPQWVMVTLATWVLPGATAEWLRNTSLGFNRKASP